MKKQLLLVLLVSTLPIFSQIPSYYNDVNLNLSGTDLKDELATKIISTHTNVLTYTPDVWDALKQSDLDPNNSNNVVLIYGWNDADSDITNDRTRAKNNHGSGSGVWNREHVYSKSLANPNLGTTGPGADAHNLRPADAQRNSSRSNRKFASGSGTASYITSSGYWYPGDEWKGDVARMMMYMYLRYGNQCLPTGVGVGNTVPTDPDMIEMFLQWNVDDPVSELEEQRNPVLEQMQGNRNPFIDNPAFATQIWGGPQAEDLFGTGNTSNDTQAPTNPTNLTAYNTTQSSVDLSWSASNDNIAVSGYKIYNGASQIATTASINYTVTNLNAGTSYNFTVRAYDSSNNTSSASNAVNITTLPGNSGGGNTTELLISEYVEGSSYNKAIEIANFTGAAISLNNYELRKATNGSGSWDATLNLSGTLAHGDVYVVANNRASTELKNKANLNSTSSVMSFNGNDAVALFKGNSLIDVIGNPNNSSNFGKDKTMQRSASINSPNTNYNANEWDVYASNTFSGLGTHTVNGSAARQAETQTLLTSNITETSVDLSWASSANNKNSMYEVYQNEVKITTVSTNSYTVSNLSEETAYNFAIKMVENNSVVATSDRVYITTLATPDFETPNSINDLYASNTTETSTVLEWTAATDNIGVIAYEVFKDNFKIATVFTTKYTVKDLTTDSSYHFSVKAIDESGNASTESNIIKVQTIDRFNNSFNKSDFNMYPNPVIGNVINIELLNNVNSNVSYQIKNIAGRTITSGSLINNLIEVSTLRPGVYFLELFDGDKRMIKKFIKN